MEYDTIIYLPFSNKKDIVDALNILLSRNNGKLYVIRTLLIEQVIDGIDLKIREIQDEIQNSKVDLEQIECMGTSQEMTIQLYKHINKVGKRKTFFETPPLIIIWFPVMSEASLIFALTIAGSHFDHVYFMTKEDGIYSPNNIMKPPLQKIPLDFNELELLKMLEDGKSLTVKELAEEIGVTSSSIYPTIEKLKRNAPLLSIRKEGRTKNYSISDLGRFVLKLSYPDSSPKRIKID